MAAQPASAKTGLSRRRSRVRVPSLPLLEVHAYWWVTLSGLAGNPSGLRAPHTGARSGSGVRPTSDSARAGGLRQSDHQAVMPMAQLGKGPPLLVGRGRRLSPRIGGSCRSGKASRISGRKTERYSRYRVFMGVTRTEGALHIGLARRSARAETIRKNKWGRDRTYVVAFLSSESPQRPLAEFVAADDYEDTRDLVAASRGSTRKAFGLSCTASGSSIRASGTRSSSSSREDDDATMLNHALIQGRRRHPT
jgi:hypothetical protein